MKIPSVFHGKAGQAASRVRKLAKMLVESRDFANYDPGTLVDTKEVAGLILVDREPAISTEQHFHCYLLPAAISEASPQAEIRTNLHDWLMASLDTEWRFMCTLGGSSWLGLRHFDPSFSRRYVEAAIRHWPAMAAERDRFGPILQVGEDILHRWVTLFAALELLGLSANERMTMHGSEPQVLLHLIDKRPLPS